ncbi:MAG: hypothetical protein WCQ99_00500 [Pseudomonadota bacterium]
MAIIEVLKQGIAFSNKDAAAQEMLADFKDHRIGMVMDAQEVTLVIKDGIMSLESGMRED